MRFKITAALVAVACAFALVPSDDADADTASWLTDRCDWIADLPTNLVGSFKGEAAMSGAGVVTLGGGATLTGGSATAAGTGTAGASAAGGFTAAAGGLVALPAATILAGATVGACAWAYENDTSDLIIAAGDTDQLDAAPDPFLASTITVHGVTAEDCFMTDGTTMTRCFVIDMERTGGEVFGRFTNWGLRTGTGAVPKPNPVVDHTPEPTYNGFPAPNPTRVEDLVRWNGEGDPTRLITDDDMVLRLWNNTTSGVLFDLPLKAWWGELTGQPWRGQKRELRGRTTCKTPGGSSTTYESWSDEYWDANAGILAPASAIGYKPPVCPAGTAPTKTIVERVRVGKISPRPTDTLFEWNIDSSVASNATSLQCWVVGTTVCPIHDSDPENPSNDLRLGGAAGVAFPAAQPRVAETLDPVRQELLLEDPVPTTTVAPTTTAATSTTTTTTTPTGTTIAPGPSTPPARDPIDPNDDEGLGCIPSGWNVLNPFAWVYQPTRCVLIWAFVPDSSLSDRWDDLRTDAQSKPPFSVVVWAYSTVAGFFDGFSSAGACGLFPDWDPTGSGEGALPCEPPGGSAWALGYSVMQIAIVVATGFYLWHMALRALSGSPEGSSE